MKLKYVSLYCDSKFTSFKLLHWFDVIARMQECAARMLMGVQNWELKTIRYLKAD